MDSNAKPVRNSTGSSASSDFSASPSPLKRGRQNWNEGGYSRFCNEEEEEEEKCGGISSSSSSGGGIGFGFIEHRVSRLDTLAGIAIKYGVEVGDIKKMNGLVTDLQMYALNSIKIPLPGRHLPSPTSVNNVNTTTPGQSGGVRASPPLYSFRPLNYSLDQNVSAAMSSLQGYYGLKPARDDDDDDDTAGTEDAAAAFLKHSQDLRTNGVMVRKGKQVSDDGKLLHTTSELLLLKEDNGSGGAFSAGIGGKGLALRSKAAAAARTETRDGFQGVRKCSSTPSLQDKATRWGVNLKPDVPRTIFDGLPNPKTAWKRKAALD